MIYEVQIEPDVLYIPITLYAPLSDEQTDKVLRELNAVQNSPVGSIRCWIDNNLLKLAIPAEDNSIGSDAFCNMADFINAIIDANDTRAELIHRLILVSSYLTPEPADCGERLLDDISAMVELFADQVILAGFSTTALEQDSYSIFEKIAGRKPDASEKSDIKAHIVQRKLEAK